MARYHLACPVQVLICGLQVLWLGGDKYEGVGAGYFAERKSSKDSKFALFDGDGDLIPTRSQTGGTPHPRPVEVNLKRVLKKCAHSGIPIKDTTQRKRFVNPLLNPLHLLNPLPNRPQTSPAKLQTAAKEPKGKGSAVSGKAVASAIENISASGLPVYTIAHRYVHCLPPLLCCI